MPGFQLKDFVSIAAAMLNHAKATQDPLTDFEVGSVARTIMESPAIEIDELYQKIFAGILDAIPTSIYKAFGFELIEKAAARGNVVVTFATPIVTPFTIPEGTVFGSAVTSLKFTSTADVAVLAGATGATVVVVCQTAGTIGNVGAGTITNVANFSLPIGSTISNEAFTSGVDAQTEAERKARFAEFILSLSRGTVAALRYAVRQAQIKSDAGLLLEYVSRVGISEEAGRVFVYIYGSSGIASSDLIAVAQQTVDGYREVGSGNLIPGYRAGGVEVDVLPMSERAIPVSLKIQPVFGVSPSQAIIDQIATLLAPEFEAAESGETLYVEQLTEAALTVPGVQKALSDNNENVLCNPNEVLKLGTLTVTWIANA